MDEHFPKAREIYFPFSTLCVRCTACACAVRNVDNTVYLLQLVYTLSLAVSTCWAIDFRALVRNVSAKKEFIGLSLPVPSQTVPTSGKGVIEIAEPSGVRGGKRTDIFDNLDFVFPRFANNVPFSLSLQLLIGNAMIR